jgi:FkbM family methyltransferase
VRGGAGAGGEGGLTRSLIGPDTPGNSTRYPEQKELNKQLVVELFGDEAVDGVLDGVEVEAEVCRLSDELRDWAPGGPIDLLKIDVEGAELEVMEGLGTSDWQRMRQCVPEVQDFDGRLDGVLGILDAQGFTVTTESAAGIRTSCALRWCTPRASARNKTVSCVVRRTLTRYGAGIRGAGSCRMGCGRSRSG